MPVCTGSQPHCQHWVCPKATPGPTLADWSLDSSWQSCQSLFCQVFVSCTLPLGCSSYPCHIPGHTGASQQWCSSTDPTGQWTLAPPSFSSPLYLWKNFKLSMTNNVLLQVATPPFFPDYFTRRSRLGFSTSSSPSSVARQNSGAGWDFYHCSFGKAELPPKHLSLLLCFSSLVVWEEYSFKTALLNLHCTNPWGLCHLL